jgi:hypothetical protein
MSLLTPLYVLGLLAVSLPIVFHLIRRTPRGDFQFSSLMFLSSSPPRLTRRSRLDHLMLLVLRGLVIALLAFAFARPFMRQAVPPEATSAERQRVAIVVDTSASMRRGDLWRQATSMVDEALAERQPFDQVALFACDDTLRTLVGFEEMSKVEPSQRRPLAQRQLESAGPTWGGSHLGRGLLEALESLTSVPEPQGQAGGAARRMVFITDLQQGGRLESLADYQWPADVTIDLRVVKSREVTNAGLQLLGRASAIDPTQQAEQWRVNVFNDKDSSVDEFNLVWLDRRDRPVGAPVDVYVPAGESRVVRMTPPDEAVCERLRLTGDAFDFDNTIYVAARPREERSVLYLGTDEQNDPEGLRYYLDRALVGGTMDLVSLTTVSPNASLDIKNPRATPLAVVGTEPPAGQVQALRGYINQGGTVLWVATRADSDAMLGELLGTPALSLEEAAVDRYTMLSEIAFNHPLFAPMAAPQFNDFTQIYFWKYRRLVGDIPNATVLAQFEKGDPAIIEKRIGQGRIVLFTSGWQPSDSQFARSWKFVLFISTLIDGSRSRLIDRASFSVNEPIPLREADPTNRELTVVKPDGTKLFVTEEQELFAATDQPGIYEIGTGDNTQRIAVNLDAAESRTSPLAIEALEQAGLRLAKSAPVAENGNDRQHLRDAQLETRQKFWQWLIAAAFCAAITETWLAGRITKTLNAQAESV